MEPAVHMWAEEKFDKRNGLRWNVGYWMRCRFLIVERAVDEYHKDNARKEVEEAARRRPR